MSPPTFPHLLDPARFEGEVDGRPTALYLLRNPRGMVVAVTNLGAKVLQIVVPDRHGALDDVALGYDSLAGVLGGSPSMGAFVGRYAGRIANGRFELDGREVQLDVGTGPHSSHGGPVGFAKRNWMGRPDLTDEGPGVVLTLISADGDQGFPGRLTISVTYRLTHDD
eukprot:gene41112-54470_t